VSEAQIDQLRRELRKISRVIRRSDDKQRERRSRQTEIMRVLVADAGLSQAEVGRDASITRMAVGLRLNKPEAEPSPV
jgi:hypothetical protein